jgi:hypothetical protein
MHNHAELLDEALVNPWADKNHLISDYLTYGEKTSSSSFDFANFVLSDTKIIRQRTVYNVIDLIAEVSGIADILYVFSASVVVYIITMNALKSELVQHVSKVILFSRPDKQTLTRIYDTED